MCRCVAYRSGMRTKAMPPACFFLLDILALALETVRPLTKDNWKFMKRTWYVCNKT